MARGSLTGTLIWCAAHCGRSEPACGRSIAVANVCKPGVAAKRDLPRAHRLMFAMVAACALFASQASVAFDLPPDTPARRAGLWVVEQRGEIAGGKVAADTRKIWSVCLGRRTDRAFHELQLRDVQASLAKMSAICGEPAHALSGDTLSATLRCIAQPPGTAGIQVRRITTFVSPEETRSRVSVLHDHGAQSAGQVVTTMKRTGTCPPDMKPGALLLMHWMLGDQETLKARQRSTIERELAGRKARIAYGARSAPR